LSARCRSGNVALAMPTKPRRIQASGDPGSIEFAIIRASSGRWPCRGASPCGRMMRTREKFAPASGRLKSDEIGYRAADREAASRGRRRMSAGRASAVVTTRAIAPNRADDRAGGCAPPRANTSTGRDRHRRRTDHACCRKRRPCLNMPAAFSSCSSVTPRQRGVRPGRGPADTCCTSAARRRRGRPRRRDRWCVFAQLVVLAGERAAMADRDLAREADCGAPPRRYGSASGLLGILRFVDMQIDVEAVVGGGRNSVSSFAGRAPGII
jgi:hypothetical protein